VPGSPTKGTAKGTFANWLTEKAKQALKKAEQEDINELISD
jgi:hypothetical protein